MESKNYERGRFGERDKDSSPVDGGWLMSDRFRLDFIRLEKEREAVSDCHHDIHLHCSVTESHHDTTTHEGESNLTDLTASL